MTENEVRDMLELHKEWLFSRKTIMIRENKDGEAYGEFSDDAIIDLDLERNVAIIEDREFELYEARGGKKANGKYPEKNIHFEGEKANLNGLDLSGMNLGNMYFSKIDANGANFTNANLGSSIFHVTELENATFENANLTNAEFRKCKLKNTNMKTKYLYNVRSDIFVTYRDLFKVKFTHYAPNKMIVGRYRFELEHYNEIKDDIVRGYKLSSKDVVYLDNAVKESIKRDEKKYFEQFDIIL